MKIHYPNTIFKRDYKKFVKNKNPNRNNFKKGSLNNKILRWMRWQKDLIWCFRTLVKNQR